MRIIDEDYYNTDGNGMMLIVEREDHRYAEAARAEGPFTGQPADEAILPGAEWWDSPNEVLTAWERTIRGSVGTARPNERR